MTEDFDTFEFVREFVGKVKSKSGYHDGLGANSYALGYIESKMGTILMTLKYHHPEAFNAALECMGEFDERS